MKSSILDLKIVTIKESHNKNERSDLIKAYQPFILKVISDLKNEYIDIHNDEEFMIGLIAFDEAITRFDLTKGHFLSFAHLVINSKIKNYWEKENRHRHENIDTVPDIIEYKNEALLDEIQLYEKELLHFDLDFEKLADRAPKHSDTRIRAIEISKKISINPIMMNHLYDKRKLPLSVISRTFDYSLRILKRSKDFIIGTSIIYYKNYEQLKTWLN